jgi:serine phosphatase RsbU (regulator of sigma subunit)
LTPPEFEHQTTRELAIRLSHSLVNDTGLNEYLSDVARHTSGLFGVDRFCLVDYREHSNRFELLHFSGYPADSRHRLQRRLPELDLERAVRQRQPFLPERHPGVLIIPCYMREILEAVILLEGDRAVELTPERQEASLLLSRLVGLFMSSTRLEVNRERLLDNHDLQQARRIQLNFLPRTIPRWPKCEAYGMNTSSKVVGGDYFDYFNGDRGTVRCILADACGHGMAAALIMSNFRGLLQTEAVRQADLERLFSSLNDRIHFDDELVQYLTGVFLHLDQETRTLEYVNAGHYEPIVINRNGEVRSLPGGGPPLGMFRGSSYPVGRSELDSGDLVALFTDGLLDIQNPDGEYFGMESLIETLRSNRTTPLEEVTQIVLDQAREFARTTEFEDDVTLFLLRMG